MRPTPAVCLADGCCCSFYWVSHIYKLRQKHVCFAVHGELGACAVGQSSPSAEHLESKVECSLELRIGTGTQSTEQTTIFATTVTYLLASDSGCEAAMPAYRWHESMASQGWARLWVGPGSSNQRTPNLSSLQSSIANRPCCCSPHSAPTGVQPSCIVALV